jgi:hypothetical protein
MWKLLRLSGSCFIPALACGVIALLATPALTQTPDGMTPAEETVCDDANLTGALWGLCNAYCEAMDCDIDSHHASQTACDRVLENFLKKSGGVAPPCYLDPDLDDDAVSNDEDNCLSDPNPDQSDVDGDGVGDVCDNCPLDSNGEQTNSDGDTLGDVCDNCPDVTNDNQVDTDMNGVGDACEAAECSAAREACETDMDCCEGLVCRFDFFDGWICVIDSPN